MPLEFRSAHDADARLLDSRPLSEEEIRALFGWFRQVSGQAIPRIQTDVALQQIAAINSFNAASGKLTRAAIFVGVCQVLVGLIAVLIAVFK
jgi:hypothetical protein